MTELIRKQKGKPLEMLLYEDDAIFSSGWLNQDLLKMKPCIRAQNIIGYVEKHIGFKGKLVRACARSNAIHYLGSSLLEVAYLGLGRKEDALALRDEVKKQQPAQYPNFEELYWLIEIFSDICFNRADDNKHFNELKKKIRNEKCPLIFGVRHAGSGTNAMLAVRYSLLGEQSRAVEVMDAIFNVIGYYNCDRLAAATSEKLASKSEAGEYVIVFGYDGMEKKKINIFYNALCAIANFHIGEHKLAESLIRASETQFDDTDEGLCCFADPDPDDRPYSTPNIAMAIAYMMQEYFKND